MSTSPTFTVSHTKEVEEEELLAIDQGGATPLRPEVGQISVLKCS